jgi:hypothetical protein
VLVVWEPVLRTDLAPPTSHVLAHIRDPRARQFWDAGRLLSASMVQAARERGDPVPENGIVWDLVATYPPGVLWKEAPPLADFSDGPVVNVIDAARRRLGAVR